MELKWPSRLVVVGGSCSGKTYLVRQMILRKDLGIPKSKLDVVVASPVLASLQQDIWKDLAARRYKIRGHHMNRTNGLPSLKPREPGRKLLLIVDDIDHVREIKKGREWLLDVFGTESHHSDVSVILIAHHLKIGAPAILSSADAVVICSMPAHQISRVSKDLGLSAEEESGVGRALCDPSGLAPGVAEYQQAYNHVVVWRKPLYRTCPKNGQLILAPILFCFGKGLETKGLIPISPERV